MNADRKAFDWTRARSFLVTAELGSFSAAARALKMSQPTVGRQVAALEQELGVPLVEYVGRGIQLTPIGLTMVEHVRAMSDAADRVALVAAGQSLSLDGKITIAASDVVAVFLLPPILIGIRKAHPGIVIEVVASNETSDLRRREADIAVRSFRPRDPELIARKINDGFARMYASPAYLESIGNPTTAAELATAEFMGFGQLDLVIEGLAGLGVPVTPSNFPVITENQFVQWELAKMGAGIALMMEEVGDAEPLVRRVIPDLEALQIPMWLASHREVRMSRRVRVVFELLAEGLTQAVRPRSDG